MNRLSGTVNTNRNRDSMMSKMSGYDDLMMILMNKVHSLSLEMKVTIFKLLVYLGGNERKTSSTCYFCPGRVILDLKLSLTRDRVIPLSLGLFESQYPGVHGDPL